MERVPVTLRLRRGGALGKRTKLNQLVRSFATDWRFHWQLWEICKFLHVLNGKCPYFRPILQHFSWVRMVLNCCVKSCKVPDLPASKISCLKGGREEGLRVFGGIQTTLSGTKTYSNWRNSSQTTPKIGETQNLRYVNLNWQLVRFPPKMRVRQTSNKLENTGKLDTKHNNQTCEFRQKPNCDLYQ